MARDPPADDGVLLAEMSTRFDASSPERAANVLLAAARLNGIELPSHGRLSYNGVVGRRTAEAGYELAPAIDRGRLVDAVGGGVCQASSTLHAAALLAGLAIEERRAHSWYSSYIAPGLDAAVAWPRRDLVIANPYDMTVRVRMEGEHGRIRIRILGERPHPGWVEVATRVVETYPWKIRRVSDPALAPGTETSSGAAQPGLLVARVRRFLRAGRTARVERLPRDRYLRRHYTVWTGPRVED